MAADPVTMIIKAIKIKIALNRLSRAKENAVRVHMGYPPIIPWYERCYINIMTSLRRCLCETFCPCCIYDRNRHLKRQHIPKSPWKRIFRDGTYENDIFKNILGFVGGVIIGLILYIIMVFQMDFRPVTSAISGALIGPILTLGLAFSHNVRCLIFLMLPHFFSSKGRSFLLLYAMILVMNHPVQNFNHNIIVLSNSSTCGQQMAYNNTKDLVDQMTSPLAGILGSVRTVLNALKEFANTLRRAFTALKVAVQEITTVLSNVIRWLASIVDVCNEKMGAPYRKCMKVFDEGYSNCRDTLGWFFGWICEIVRVVQNVCHVARIGELLCIIASAIKSLVIDKIAPPMNSAIDTIYDMFYFNVTIYYKYTYNLTQSKSYSKVKDDIMRDIKGRLNNYSSVTNFVQNIIVFAFLFVLINLTVFSGFLFTLNRYKQNSTGLHKALLYRAKYLTEDKFDNIYITYKIRDIEERRLEMGKEGILPLHGKESKKYIKAYSPVMAKSEKSKMIKGMFFLLISGFHAGFYMTCDYSLFWLLLLIRRNGAITTGNMVPPHLKMHVQGNGAVADMYRALIGMFDPLAEAGLNIDSRPCLPNPTPPDLSIYKEIAIIFGMCLFMTIFEAYGLRLRHVVAACYYPRRERARAVWLYNHILKMRGSFLKFARRQARRKFANFKEQEKISIRGRLSLQFPFCGKVFKYLGWKRKHCLSCGKEGREEDFDNFIHCANNNCEAVYCMDCFTDLNNLCTVCMNPVDYGDISDISEERDSSEDEEELERKKEEAQERKRALQEKRKQQTASKQLLNLKNQLGITESDIRRQAVPQTKRLGESDFNDDVIDPLEDEMAFENNALMSKFPENFDYDYTYQYGNKDGFEEIDEEEYLEWDEKPTEVDLVTTEIFNEEHDDTGDVYYEEDDMYDEYLPVEPEELEIDRNADNRVHTL